MKKTVLGAVICLGIVAGAASVAMAQEFPNRPIRVVVPYPPGGGTDNLIRLLVPSVSKTIGQPLLIENHAGGNTMIGTRLVAQAEPNGYTILAQSETDILGPLVKDRAYDPLQTFTGVVTQATAPIIMTVHPSIDARTLAELIALSKRSPGMLNFASSGVTSTTRLAAELFKIETGANATAIPYKGTGASMTDSLAGTVQLLFGGISSVKQHAESGRLRPLAVTGPTRNRAMPVVPTFAELGFPGVDLQAAWMLFVPKGTPVPVVRKLNEHFVRTLKDPEMVAKMVDLSFEPVANTPEQVNELISKARSKMIFIFEKARITDADS